jgi:hypothetical protein
MYRLTKQALEILRAEVQKCSSSDAVGQVEKQIVIKRLEKLRLEKGSPAMFEELRDCVVDVYPQFSQKILKQAASSNQPPGVFSKIKWFAVLGGSAAAMLWLVNLPYPMIRKPIAKTAPILLLPSYISMDRSYRKAIAAVEQADQLINKSTSAADIEQGGKKVKEAQKNLDNLPVWFLGYYPESYCNLFGCSWKFTVDEFENARKNIARLDAQVFQNKNAFTPLNQAEVVLKGAKQQFETATKAVDKEKAIASWQGAIDTLEQIPTKTLAGETAQTKLIAYKRDFENARNSTFIAVAQEFDLEAEKIKQKQSETASELWQQAINRLNEIPKENPRYLDAQKLMAQYQVKQHTVVDPTSSTFIEAAKQFAFAAAKASQNPPHTTDEWEQVESLWSKTIEQLKNIRVEQPGYLEAQKLLATYESNLGIVKIRKEAERQSTETLKEALNEIRRFTANPPSDTNQFRAELQGIINQLQTIKPGTTAYKEAQQLLLSAQKRL